jgi:hypothetical protein
MFLHVPTFGAFRPYVFAVGAQQGTVLFMVAPLPLGSPTFSEERSDCSLMFTPPFLRGRSDTERFDLLCARSVASPTAHTSVELLQRAALAVPQNSNRLLGIFRDAIPRLVFL